MAKNVAVVSEIRQLCCLGLPAQEVMPLVLKTLHRLIPSRSNLFDWLDEDCQITNYYAEGPHIPEVAQLYFEEFYNKRECEVMPAYSDQVRTTRGVINSEPISNPTFYGSDFYNLIWRPRGLHHRLEAIVHEHGPALGSLVLYRGEDEPQFTRQDEHNLASLIPYVAHALGPHDGYNGAYTPSGDVGLIIMSGRGKLLNLSAEGRHLLFLATHPRSDPQSMAKERSEVKLPHALVKLCADLIGIARGEPAPPPVVRERNAWGVFTFRAHWLERGDDSADQPIVVTIERRVPFPLHLARSVQALPLSVRQKELCVLLARGLSYAAVAKRMNVTENTAISYARVVYQKLGLAGREDLLKTLLAPAMDNAG